MTPEQLKKSLDARRFKILYLPAERIIELFQEPLFLHMELLHTKSAYFQFFRFKTEPDDVHVSHCFYSQQQMCYAMVLAHHTYAPTPHGAHVTECRVGHDIEPQLYEITDLETFNKICRKVK